MNCKIMRVFLILFLLKNWAVAAEAQNDNSVFCFQCNSFYEPECETLTKNDTHSLYYRVCQLEERISFTKPFCRKIQQKITVRNNIKRIIRTCGVEADTRDCYRTRNQDHDETICQCFENGCNVALFSHQINQNLIIFVLITLVTCFHL